MLESHSKPKKHSEQHRTKTAIKEEERSHLVSKPEKLLKNEIAACVLVILPHVTFDGRHQTQQPRRSSPPGGCCAWAAAPVPPRRTKTLPHRETETQGKKTKAATCLVSMASQPRLAAIIAALRRRPAAFWCPGSRTRHRRGASRAVPSGESSHSLPAEQPARASAKAS